MFVYLNFGIIWLVPEQLPGGRFKVEQVEQEKLLVKEEVL